MSSFVNNELNNSENTISQTEPVWMNALNKYFNIAVLRLCVVSSDQQLIDLYTSAVEAHNAKFHKNQYIDAGFDLFATTLEKKEDEHWSKMNFQVKAEMKMYCKTSTGPVAEFPTGYYVHPRSSLSKTNLRLANSTGIIDSGYRGCLMGMFDDLSRQEVVVNMRHCVNTYDRVVQICAPALIPMYVELIFNESDLSVTERGDGGIGSTGK